MTVVRLNRQPYAVAQPCLLWALSSLTAAVFCFYGSYQLEGATMKRQYEERPTDTVVIREAFRNAMTRRMNSLMEQGYRPSGGISTHMNTHTKPILGIDSQEYTQTMIKYENYEVWVKESTEDWDAYKVESSRNHLFDELERVGTSLRYHMNLVKDERAKIDKAQAVIEGASDSFMGKMKKSGAEREIKNANKKIDKVTPTLESNKKQYTKVKKEIEATEGQLVDYYKANPAISRDILIKSR